uniref:Serine/threonine/dual specificity protein kinase, catalytic domain-containing protein n=1 Tax=Tanacetum cinerariifolium TaxID=118510 RepID=A0A699IBR3_TANCI|nr:serine/threonine/dual specificity protein kinase, catalytic domain-containing protein [Tanacetum cinerariifolium]
MTTRQISITSTRRIAAKYLGQNHAENISTMTVTGKKLGQNHGENTPKMKIGVTVRRSRSQREYLGEECSATQNFYDKLVFGRGGFGKVYKGDIKSQESGSTIVAIKRLDSTSDQGAPEFVAKIEMLSRDSGLAKGHHVDWTQRCVRKRNLDKLVSAEIRGQSSPRSLKEFAQIPYRCLDGDLKERSKMSEVAVALQLS